MKTRLLIGFIAVSLLVLSSIPMANAGVGDSFNEAQEASLGDNTGKLTTDYDDHWFVFNADPEQGYLIELLGPANTDLDMDILDSTQDYIEGIYGVEYPDIATVVGYSQYYLRVYSAYGAGDFNVRISEYTLTPGFDENLPQILEIGYQEFNTNNTFREMFFELTPTAGMMYEFQLIPLSPDTSIDGDFQSYDNYDYNYGYGYNSTWDDHGRSAFVIAGNSNITGRIYAWRDNGFDISFGIRVIESVAPTGVTRQTAFQLNMTSSLTFPIYNGLDSYLRVEFTDEDWYSFAFSSEFEFGFSIEISDTNGYYYDYMQGYSNGITYTRQHVGTFYLRIDIWDSPTTNLTVSMGREVPPPGYSEENPIILGESQVTTELTQAETYFSPTITEGNAYLFHFSFDPADYYDVDITIYNWQEGYYVDNYYYGNEGEVFFVAETDQVMIVVHMWDYQRDGGVNLSASIEQIDAPDHITRETAAVADLGDNFGSTIYNSQPYWFVFETERDFYYTLSIEGRYSGYIYFEVYDQYDSHIGYGEDYGDTTVYGDGGSIYIRVMSSNPTSFTLTISIGDEPVDDFEAIYSPNFQAGDYFEWEISVTGDLGYIGAEESWLQNGNKIKVEVLQDQPVVNSYQSESSFFRTYLNGEVSQDLGFDLFILPVEINDYDHHYSKIEILENYFGGGGQVQDTGDTYVLTLTESYDDEFFNFELEFDAEDMFLRSLDYSASLNGTEFTLQFDLTDSKISGPPDETDDNPFGPAIDLPFSPIGLFALLAIPILRRRTLK